MDVSDNGVGTCAHCGQSKSISCPCEAEWDKWLCIKGCGNEVLEDRLCIRHWLIANPNKRKVTKLAIRCEHYDSCNNAEFRRARIIISENEDKIISLCREHYDLLLTDIWIYELRWVARVFLQNTGEVP